MRRVNEKKYYETWKEFMILIEKKKFNNNFMNQDEFEKLREEVLNNVKYVESMNLCKLMDIEKKYIAYDSEKYIALKRNNEQLNLLIKKLQNNCEDITERDFKNTYIDYEREAFREIRIGIIVVIVSLIYYWLGR